MERRGTLIILSFALGRTHGQMVPVCVRIARIDSMSVHADRGEILQWLGTFPSPPGTIYLVYGEPKPVDALQGLLAEQRGLEATAAGDVERVEV